ncbi:hypothetical protein N7526_009628 [Penicillium atrosanguineum]|nr:hypothetical protein N7526_009628 [Penicillium atrosanguineum]
MPESEVSQTVGALTALEQDLKQIWTWNAHLPKPHAVCLHSIIAHWASESPERLAIDAWDGSFTFFELDSCSSQLAQHLSELGVRESVVVPLAFERSRFTAVAILAVLKLGAAFVLLDAGLPESRLKNIVEQVKAEVVLASPVYLQLAGRLAATVVTVPVTDCISDSGSESCSSGSAVSTDVCSPLDPLSTTACIVFTSGTTGNPKGILISHANLASTFNYTAKTVGLNETTRMLDSASYGFDAAIYQALGTLSMGGCLCVPSDSERLTAIASVIEKFKVNTAILTPSVARLVDPRDVPSLKRLKLVGEPSSPDLINKWLPHSTLVMGYGPSECAVCSNAGVFYRNSTVVNNIGPALGCCAWIVDPDDHNILLPVGRVGEMLLEGPNVGQGYLNDKERTTAAFMNSPTWLTTGFGSTPGRSGTLYKTGDLVQYERDGSVLYIGRKDQQKKLHGQRIDLTEIEHAMVQALPIKMEVIAEVCTTAMSPSEPQLIAFCCLASPMPLIEQNSPSEITGATSILLPASKEFLATSQQIREKLQIHLPSYMIPAFIFPVSGIPRAKPSDKLDRKRVVQEVGQLSQTQLRKYFPISSKQLNTPKEKMLQTMLRELLALDIDILADDHFFRLGGNSITAIQLIAIVRKQGMLLLMSDVLNHDNLADLASKMTDLEETEKVIEPIPAFSLLPSEQQELALQKVKEQYGIDATSIDDIIPCTPLQEGMMALGQQRLGGNIAQRIFDLAPGTELGQLKEAWKTVSQLNSILRTRIIDTSTKLLQVVMRDPLIVEEYDDSRLDAESTMSSIVSRMGLGAPLVHVAILSSDEPARPDRLIWTAHHAACDGWQVPQIFTQVERAYRGDVVLPEVDFNHFVKYITDANNEKQDVYWKTQLAGPTPSTFPPSHQNSSSEWANESKSLPVYLGNASKRGFLLATSINLAWSMVIAAYAESPDVIFGLTLTGRNAPVAVIESMTGPTITTVPFRHLVDHSLKVDQALDRIQKQLSNMIPFEQAGLQNIRRMSPEAASACNLQSLLVIQPPMANEIPHEMLINGKEVKSRLAFSNYPLTMECIISPGEQLVNVSAQFNSRIIHPDQMTHILHQFGHVLRQIHENSDVPLQQINMLSPFDLERLTDWNSACPVAASHTLNQSIETHSAAEPKRQAVDAWDGSLTFRELDTFASQFATHLQQLAVGPEDVVPVCLEKSRLVPVVMLAILKTGAACTLVDDRLPQNRVNQMLSNSRARYFVCSETSQNQFDLSQTGAKKLVVTLNLIQQLPSCISAVWNTNPDTPAFVVYTSGSTGRPKGVVLEHRALSTSILAHGAALKIGTESRMLQFASCSFDISIYEHMTTLVLGGCVCIPSDDARMNQPAQYARESGATITLSTPTVMHALGQDDIPTMQMISLGGEPITHEVVEIWKQRAQVCNGYGPAECTICAMHPIEAQDGGNPLATIGRGLGCTFWVVDIASSSRLAPVGVVGELYIEGPILARGYLNDSESTAKAFLSPPEWLRKFRPNGSGNRVYKTGDLVRYNTDGTVVFVGRRDTQTKLRGQRIELSDVEYHLKNQLVNSSIVVEVASLLGTSHLVGFVENQNQSEITGDSSEQDSLSNGEQLSTGQTPAPEFSFKTFSETREEDSSALHALSLSLPPYMVPSLILRVTSMPKTLTGKTDRKALREAVNKLTLDEVSLAMQGKTEHRLPSNDVEIKLRDLWADILRLPKDRISADDNFIARGGDSIAAMRLVSSGRPRGIHLTVQDVLMAPKLSSMAEIAGQKLASHKNTTEQSNGQHIWEPFHALPNEANTRQKLIHDILRPLETDVEKVSDIIPATSLQEFALSNCATFFIFNVGDRLDIGKAILSWETLVTQHDVLRTLFAFHKERFYQVILKSLPKIPHDVHNISEDTDAALDQLLRDTGASKPLPMGSSPLKFMTVNSPQNRYLVLRMSHSQYDGFSISEFWGNWGLAFDGQPLPPRRSYSDFVYSSDALGGRGGYSYWKCLLNGSSMTYLTTPPVDTIETEGNSQLVENKTVVGSIHSPPGITLATFVQGVWILTLARWTRKRDIVFGLVTSGRRSKRHDFDTVMGPCLQIMPVRAKLQDDWSMHDLCQLLQRQGTDSMEFEGMELSRIVEHCTEWDPDAPLGTWVQHDNTDWNASLVLGCTDYGAPRVYDEPYGQDDIGLETYLLNDESLEELRKMTVQMMNDLSANPDVMLATFLPAKPGQDKFLPLTSV